VFKEDGELQDIAADGIGDFDFCGGVGKFAGVARGLEVIEEGRGEHGESIAASGAECRGRGKRRRTVTQRSQREEHRVHREEKEGFFAPRTPL